MTTGRRTLRIGVAQIAIEVELAENERKILGFIIDAKVQGCDLVVFPEGALDSPRDTTVEALDRSIEAIRQAAANHSINVVLGLMYRRNAADPMFNQLRVFGRSGAVTFVYNKLWNDTRFLEVPRAFLVDGVACNGAICADRWIRAVEELPVIEGARVLIEISNNHAREWVADLGLYWYVPRAIRNQAFVVFCNSARESLGRVARGDGIGHGHSAVIDPAGRILAAAGEEADNMLVADLDIADATAGEATRRHHHPLMKRFWDVGAVLLRGGSVQVEAFQPLPAQAATISVAAAQIAVSRKVSGNMRSILASIAEAARQGADIVALPELAITGTISADVAAFGSGDIDACLKLISRAAAKEKIAVAFGAPWPRPGRRPHNAAFVINAEGGLMTRYDQIVVDRPALFDGGASTRAMWFELKSVPAIVTIGTDGRWNEFAELAGIKGARRHLHLANEGGGGPGEDLQRRQFWVTLATNYTMTATVNAAENRHLAAPSAPASGGSVIWNDLRSSHRHARPYRDQLRYCAVPLAEAGAHPQMLFAAAPVPETGVNYREMVEQTVPSMRAWYDAGAGAIRPDGR